MISVAMLRGGAANARYYVERAADCDPSRYYTGSAEQAGRWCGGGAAALGLNGPVTGERAGVFAGLLDGVLPDGTRGALPVWRRPANGPAEARVDVRRSGLDVVVSAPKSVSVLFALGDSRVAGAVTAAHGRAVEEAIGYLERHASHGLRGHQGGDQRPARIETSGLVAAAFTHRTSRSDDPQLHTHLVVANLVHGRDGKWSAVDSRAVYNHARTAGCIYQAVLRGELTRTLGVGWGPVQRGVAEVAGVPKAVTKEFSTRRKAIEAELDRTGSGGRRAAQRAAYLTRPQKTHTPELQLRALWRDRVRDCGYEPREVVASVLDRSTPSAMPAEYRLAGELFGPSGLTEHSTSFDRRDAIQALTETITAGTAVTGTQLESVTDRLLSQSEEALPLLQASNGTHRRWSTRNLIAAERWALAASNKRTAIGPLLPVGADTAAAAPWLSTEQRAVVAGLVNSPDLVDVVVGPAGSGKTAALRAAAEHWTRCGVPVVGCSLAAVTARRLESATKIPSSSLARLLGELEHVDPELGQPAGLAPRSVVICDEASMIGTRQMAQLLRHTEYAGGKLVLVGDPEQLSEVDAGGMFAALARQVEPLSLTGNQRQIATWESAALTHLRAGEIDAALDAYLGHGRIHVGSDTVDVRTLLAEHYVGHYVDGASVVALASSQRDAAALNAAIRTVMRAADEIGSDAITVTGETGDRAYAQGDQVIVTRNDHRLGLLNGTRGQLIDVSAQEMSLMRDDTDECVPVTVAWAAEHLDYGYAMTVHKAQGLTTGVSLLYGSAALCQQAGYVAMSRGAEANHLYTSDTALAGHHTGVEVDVPRFELMNGPDPADVLDRLRARLAVSQRHALAIDQRPIQRPLEPEAEPYRFVHDDHDRSLGRSR
jgi:conjugative relaxase-like TrwC/TraI family protein